jgi:uncharacterized membrane protein YhfC
MVGLAVVGAQVVACLIAPLALWIGLTRRLQVSWRYILLGCATWLSAAPFSLASFFLAPTLFGGGPLVLPVAVALTAGIGEELSRYVYYRRSAGLRDPHAWRTAVVAGAGHGGCETVVVGSLTLVAVVAVFFFREWLPPALRGVELPALAYLLGALLRVLAIFGHIFLTLLVWRAVSQGRPADLLRAMAAHIAIDLIGFGFLLWWPWAAAPALLALDAGLAAGAVWMVRRARRSSPARSE